MMHSDNLIRKNQPETFDKNFLANSLFEGKRFVLHIHTFFNFLVNFLPFLGKIFETCLIISNLMK